MKVDDPMSTDETAEALVDQLATAGGWPDPRILTAIVECKSESVEPLRALIRRDPEEEDLSIPISFAVDLLGCLGDASVVPDLFDILRRSDDLELVESVRDALRAFKTEKIEPALEIARDRSLDDYPRDTAIHIAIDAAGDDMAARARIAEGLREMLAECISRGKEDADQADWPAYLVSTLADLADPLARDLIDSAFQAGIVRPGIISPKDVERSYRKGGARWAADEPSSWLTEYEHHYEKHLEWQRGEAEQRRQAEERRMAEPRPFQPIYESPAPEQSRPIPPPVETIRNTAPRPGRNDPCWCGSGKKYKKCHLSQDQG